MPETVSCGLVALVSREKYASAHYARRKGGVSIRLACARAASTSVHRQWHRLQTADPHSGLIALACLCSIVAWVYVSGAVGSRPLIHLRMYCTVPRVQLWYHLVRLARPLLARKAALLKKRTLLLIRNATKARSFSRQTYFIRQKLPLNVA